jgi:hypothetical protein
MTVKVDLIASSVGLATKHCVVAYSSLPPLKSQRYFAPPPAAGRESTRGLWAQVSAIGRTRLALVIDVVETVPLNKKAMSTPKRRLGTATVNSRVVERWS